MEASDSDLMPPVEAHPVAVAADPVATALNALSMAADVQVTSGGGPGAELPPVVFDRKSVERRVLGHITDEVDNTLLGPRNTLAAIYHAVSTDRNTTHPPGGNPRLDIDGLTLEGGVAAVHAILSSIVDEGLALIRDDGSYELTDLGNLELAS